MRTCFLAYGPSGRLLIFSLHANRQTSRTDGKRRQTISPFDFLFVRAEAGVRESFGGDRPAKGGCLRFPLMGSDLGLARLDVSY